MGSVFQDAVSGKSCYYTLRLDVPLEGSDRIPMVIGSMGYFTDPYTWGIP